MISPNNILIDNKTALIELVLREIEMHQLGDLESFATNQKLAERLRISKTSVTRYLRELPENERNYRTRKIISANSKENAKENIRLGKGIFGLSSKQLSEAGKKGGRKILRERLGIHGLSKGQTTANAKKGGQSNAKNKTGFCSLSTKEKRKIGLNAYEQGTGIHGLTEKEKITIAKKGGRRATKLKKGVHALSAQEKRNIGLAVYNSGKGIHSWTFEQKSKLSKKNARILAERNMNISHNKNNYHSASEAALASLFEKYIPRWKIEKGKTWQIDIKTGIIDFLVNRSFIEYHPPKPFYGKSRRGDFRSHEEYEKYASIKTRIRNKKGAGRARDFQTRVNYLISRKYEVSRKLAVENSQHTGTALIYCSSAEDIYDKIISKHSDTPKQEFLSEFRKLRRQIIKNKEKVKKVA